jgi:hypothetical protein
METNVVLYYLRLSHNFILYYFTSCSATLASYQILDISWITFLNIVIVIQKYLVEQYR